MGFHTGIIVLIAIAAVVITGIACYRLGLRDGEDDDPRDFVSGFLDSLKYPESESSVVVDSFLKSLPMPVAVSDQCGQTLFVSRQFGDGVLEDGRFTNTDILDLLRVVADIGSRRTRRLSTDGGETWYSITVAPFGNDLYSVTSTDVTEQVNFERVRRDFVTNVSHELKTPTGAISLLAETITDCADDPDSVRHFSKRISKECDRLSDLISKLIQLQKAQSVVPDSSIEPICMAPVIAMAINDVDVQAKAKHISIESKLDPKATAHISADSLRTVVKNLVENAVRYSDDGSHVSVTADTNDEGGARIRVLDNGIGISASEQKRIFERFYRVDRGRSRYAGGTGVGLAIVQNTVHDAGGTVDVWSRVGDGTTFTVQFPAVDAARHGGPDGDGKPDAADATSMTDETADTADDNMADGKPQDEARHAHPLGGGPEERTPRDARTIGQIDDRVKE
ncbi:MAG: ATP-binding protein [Bifidobacteriaceae bacterium]|nr:ATP-binding protein [Bifidobacteriaceae bacterium]